MKKFTLLASIVAFSSSLLAADLVSEARGAGLLPIPSNFKELNKLVGNPSSSMIELGKKLYFDPRLSKSSLISCNTCHNLATGGTDGVSAAIGHKWTANPHDLNSPTVYNAAFASVQFWDGRDPHLEAQAQGPIQAGPEMAAPKELVITRLSSMPEYVAEFGRNFKDGVTFKNTADAIAAFEKTLVTPSRFDKFLEGNKKALSDAEQKGLKTFIDKGCATCHNGVAVGGTMMPFGFDKYTKASGDFKGDKNGMVKVPTLRNILETAPYYHNGAIWDIKEAVVEMGKIQLNTTLTDAEAASIVTFFGALTGDKPTVKYPVLPASTLSTPRPDSK